jgi:predicted nucleic acid-binding protein
VTPVLLDTGVIVAWLDRSERYHRACVELVADLTAPLVTCEAVIAESCYLLRELSGAADAVLENLQNGVFQIPIPLPHDTTRVRRIMRKYGDRQVDLADACLVHLAEDLNTGHILTLDRDFQVYRWRGNRRFQMLLDLD